MTRSKSFLLKVFMFILLLVAIKRRSTAPSPAPSVHQKVLQFGKRRAASSNPGQVCLDGKCLEYKHSHDHDYDDIYRYMDQLAEQIYEKAEADALHDTATVPIVATSVQQLEELGADLLLRSLPTIRNSLLLEIIQINAGTGGLCKSFTTFTTDPGFDKNDLWYPLSRHAGLLVNGTYLEEHGRLIAVSDRDLNSRNSPLQHNCGIPRANTRHIIPMATPKGALAEASRLLESRGKHKSHVKAANEVIADVPYESILGILIIPSEVPYEDVEMIHRANTMLSHYFQRPQRFGNVFAIVDNKLMAIITRADYNKALIATTTSVAGGKSHVINPKTNRRIKADGRLARTLGI